MDDAGRLETGSHCFFVVAHTFGDGLVVGVVGLERNPLWRKGLGYQAAFVHFFGEHFRERQLIECGNKTILFLELLLQLSRQLANIANYVSNFREINEVLLFL